MVTVHADIAVGGRSSERVDLPIVSCDKRVLLCPRVVVSVQKTRCRRSAAACHSTRCSCHRPVIGLRASRGSSREPARPSQERELPRTRRHAVTLEEVAPVAAANHYLITLTVVL